MGTKIFWWIMILLFIVSLLTAITMQIISNHKCKSVCEEKGTMIYDVIENGEWNTEDACVCYFPYSKNKIEVSILK